MYRALYFTGVTRFLAAIRMATTGCWGRVDDVMNVSGHRLRHYGSGVSSGASSGGCRSGGEVGKPHELTGQAVCAFVTLKKGDFNPDTLGVELRQWVAHEIARAFLRVRKRSVLRTPFSETRSGKIMRRLLGEIVTSNVVTGDVTTLEDLSVVTNLAAFITTKNRPISAYSSLSRLWEDQC